MIGIEVMNKTFAVKPAQEVVLQFRTITGESSPRRTRGDIRALQWMKKMSIYYWMCFPIVAKYL